MALTVSTASEGITYRGLGAQVERAVLDNKKINHSVHDPCDASAFN